MRLHAWLAICSSSACTTTENDSTIPFPKNRPPPPNSWLPIQAAPTATFLVAPRHLATLAPPPALCVASIKPRTSLPITCLAVHGNLLYAASSHEINVYDSATSTHLDAFNCQDSSSGSVKAVTFCDGKVFTAHQDCKIRVWQITATKRHKLLATLPTINDRLRRFVLPKNYVTVRRHKKRLWIEHDDAVTGLAVNNGLIYSVSWDKSLKVWRASDVRCVEAVKAHEDAVNAVAVSADGTVYTGSADKRIRVWAKPFGEKRQRGHDAKYCCLAVLDGYRKPVKSLAAVSEGASNGVVSVFGGTLDGEIKVWQVSVSSLNSPILSSHVL
ncbi:hypothetical protein SLA2020_411410 [Shorea laevis]